MFILFYFTVVVVYMDKECYKLCDLNFIQGKFARVKSQPPHEGDSVAHISVDKTSQLMWSKPKGKNIESNFTLLIYGS
jgi:hypothetical protein